MIGSLSALNASRADELFPGTLYVSESGALRVRVDRRRVGSDSWDDLARFLAVAVDSAVGGGPVGDGLGAGLGSAGVLLLGPEDIAGFLAW